MSDISVTVTNPGSASVTIGAGDVVAATVSSGGSVLVTVGTTWDTLAGKPDTFPPSPHLHPIADVTGLQDAIDGKAAAVHSHVIADVSGLQAALDGKAATGTYATLVDGKVPSGQLPSYVDDVLEVANYAALPGTGEAGKIYLTLSDNKVYRWSGSTWIEIVASPGSIVSSVNSLTGALTLAAGANVTITPSGSTLTVAAAAPTPLADATPQPLGTAAVGTSTDAAREDHVHAMPTAADVGALDENSVVDGGSYVGYVSSTITITGQPTDQTASGGAATFSVTATVSPSGTPTYQWQKGEVSASAGVTWTGGTVPYPVTALAYGGGRFLTVTQGSTDVYGNPYCLTSTDGATWTRYSMPPNYWFSVVYGGGLFVTAASGSPIVATSQDGTSWTQRSLPIAAQWDSYAYGNGRFVIVGGAACVTSTDGIAWGSGSLPSGPTDYQVAYGNGVFVAVGRGTTTAATSTDGVTWTQRTLPASALWSSVAYGNGVFVAVAQTGTVAASSPDGVTWTQRTMPVSLNIVDIEFGGGLFVAIANNSAVALTSSDGIAWNQRTMPSTQNWASVAYGDGLFVATAVSNSATARSGGITWSNVTGETSSTISLSGLTASDNQDKYRVTVSATNANSVTSDSATLTVP